MDVFDIIGPVMIGPSSSHTAGAARIGRVARGLLGEAPVSARIGLCGSFAATGSGHGTDRAIVAGLLDMAVDDPRLRDSFQIAQAQGLAFTFYTAQLRDAHPNTALIEASGSTRSVKLRAASVGGGSIRVEAIDDLAVSFSGESHTLVLPHRDKPGVIAQVTRLLAEPAINIGTMQVSREQAGGEAVMVLEVDALPDAELVEKLSRLKDVERVALIRRIE
ncbi:MAG: L-serine ammonia-lyase, iron-sulfur-dependent subunit beta [Clostridia bacterium]